MPHDVMVPDPRPARPRKLPSAADASPSASLRLLPREHEIRIIERDGRRLLQQWKMPPAGYLHDRAWVDVGELPVWRARSTASGTGTGTAT